MYSPGAQLRYFNDGGRGVGSYFIPTIKISTSEFVYQKNPYYFSIPQKFHTSSKMRLCCWFELMKDTKRSVTQKNPGIFHRPEKFPIYVSGAPGIYSVMSLQQKPHDLKICPKAIITKDIDYSFDTIIFILEFTE